MEDLAGERAPSAKLIGPPRGEQVVSVRLLVTGGAGFMGSNYVHHTAATNPEARILVYGKLTYAGCPGTL